MSDLRSRTRTALAVLALAILSSCAAITTGPARTSTTYQHKAATTAQAASSAVATTMLAAEAAADGKAFDPYLSVLVSNAEDALGTAATTFEGIQPPSVESDALRAELVELLGTASDDVAATRIAVRRGDHAKAAEMIEALRSDVEALTAFAEANR